jgi:hypothetical protein
MSTDYLLKLNAKYLDRKWAFVIKHKLRWADVDLSFELLQELVAERAVHTNYSVPTTTKFQLDREKFIAEEQEKQKYENYKQDQQLLCQACGVFKHHSRPPADWTPSDYVFCCLHCRDTKGMSHGNRCLKCAPAPFPVTEEDNGY